MGAGVVVVRDHSTPGREPTKSDKFLVLDEVGGGSGLVTDHCPLTLMNFEKATVSRDLRDHSVQAFHFISEPRKGKVTWYMSHRIQSCD